MDLEWNIYFLLLKTIYNTYRYIWITCITFLVNTFILFRFHFSGMNQCYEDVSKKNITASWCLQLCLNTKMNCWIYFIFKAKIGFLNQCLQQMFIFNTLNKIKYLAYKNGSKVSSLLAKLSKIFQKIC